MRNAFRVSLVSVAVLVPFAAREARRILRPEPGGTLAGLIGSPGDTGADIQRFPADPRGVLAAVQSITGDLMACRSAQSDFEGKLRLELTVEAAPDGDDGYVSGAWVRDAPPEADGLGECVSSEVEKLHFDAPKFPLTVVTSIRVFASP